MVAVNHVAPFALTHALLPTLRASRGRIVQVVSDASPPRDHAVAARLCPGSGRHRSTSRASCARAGLRPTEIAVALDVDKGALSRLLSALDEAGLVAKRPPPHGRAIAVALTHAGEKRLARVLADKGAELTDRLVRSDDGELAALASLLRRLNEP